MEEPFKIHVTSLGCPKNLADTEHVLAIIEKSIGFVKYTEKKNEADIFLVNTCAFIEDAVSESIEAILELSNEKRENQVLVVFGCLPLRYGHELGKLLPEVDLFVFHVEPSEAGVRILQYLNRKTKYKVSGYERVITGYPWQMYIKISDGCPNKCTYCLIPKMRGGLRCRNPEAIISEIDIAVERGAREVTLVAQDITSYKKKGYNITWLVEEVLSRTDVPWLRLMYLYPGGIDDELLGLIAKEDRICGYLDIPVQHASSRILSRMGRQMSGPELDKTMERIRHFLPDASLRTTVMVGFPGEEESDFNLLVDFIKRWRFHYVGCFVYSDEADAPSHLFKEKVERQTAEKRREFLMAVQKDITHAINMSFVGRELDVLVEGYCRESGLLLCSRTKFQAPEIDGITYINKGFSDAGAITRVKITKVLEYDLLGEIV